MNSSEGSTAEYVGVPAGRCSERTKAQAAAAKANIESAGKKGQIGRSFLGRRVHRSIFWSLLALTVYRAV